MKEHPILFSADMVQAILAGKKDLTRRIVKNEVPIGKWEDTVKYFPYGQIGDLIWVRETMIYNKNSQTYWPKADGYQKTASYEKVVPSILVPKINSRIWLQIKNVRIELLHDITEEDAIREGVKLSESGTKYLNYIDRKHGLTQFIYNCHTAKRSFLSLWEFINKCGNVFCVDPFVWVIEFEVLSTTGRPEIINHKIQNN